MGVAISSELFRRCPAPKVAGQAGNGPKPFAFELGNEIIVRLTLGATLRTLGAGLGARCHRFWEIKLRPMGIW